MTSAAIRAWLIAMTQDRMEGVRRKLRINGVGTINVFWIQDKENKFPGRLITRFTPAKTIRNQRDALDRKSRLEWQSAHQSTENTPVKSTQSHDPSASHTITPPPIKTIQNLAQSILQTAIQNESTVKTQYKQGKIDSNTQFIYKPQE